MKWEPSDVIRFAALIGGIALFTLGAYMMILGIQAEGAIDIKSSVISGTLKSGSAGLFICFLSFILVVFVLTSLGRAHSPSTSTKEKSRFKSLLPVFWSLTAGVVVTGGLGATGYGAGFGLLAALLGFLLLITVVAMLTFLENE